MKSIIACALIASAAFLSSCCCFEPDLTDADSPIIVREATLAEFNSRFIGNNPDPKFNIAMFQFPSSVGSSGQLPNDNRFANGAWTNQVADYPLRGLTSFYVFSTPPNSLINGDFLAVDVNPTTQRALMRVKGKLLRLPNNPALLTDNATTFANEIRQFAATQNIPSGSSLCKILDAQAIAYGTTTASSALSFDTMYVKTNAGADTNLVYPSNWPVTTNGTLLPPIKTINDIGVYEVSFAPGDWFYYRAVNGMSFFVLVTNIQAGVLSPNVNRVTFKFAEAYECLDCKQ